MDFSEKEWQNSWNYYSNLYREAYIQYALVKNFITKNLLMTKEKKDKNLIWKVSFSREKLFVGTKEEFENFQLEDPKVEDMYHTALERMYLYEDPDKKDNILKYMAKEITFQVTEDCNLACTYCYQHNKKPNTMDFSVAKQTIDWILNNDEKISSYLLPENMIGAIIEFIGGEPWLEAGLIHKISNYFIQELFRLQHPWAIKFMFSMSTNGILQKDNEQIYDYFNKHYKHLSYSVSVDGNKKLHDACRLDKNGKGTYDRAIYSALEYSNKYNSHLNSKITISPFNVYYIKDAIINLINLGYYHINLNCAMEIGWKTEHATELYKQLCSIADYLKNTNKLDEIEISIFSENKGIPSSELGLEGNSCGGTGNMLAVDWQGNFYPCIRYMPNAVRREPYVIGNLEVGLNKEKIHKERVSYLRAITRISQLPEKCLSCPIDSLCPSCNGHSYDYYGDPNKRATFVCEMYQAEVLANLYYYSLKNIKLPFNIPKEWAINIIGEEEYLKLKRKVEEI